MISPVKASTQLTLDFEPGLTDRHTTCLAVVKQGAYTHRNPLKTLAADMDMSLSELSRKLGDNPNDVRQFTLNDFEVYLEKSGDLDPIYYLIEKFLTDEDVKQRRALNQLAKQVPNLMALLKQVNAAQA
jgi:hypothetical protein